MRRSEINALLRDAERCLTQHGWALPPEPRWDVTDFGLGDWRRFGLVLVNLAEEPEYCEKILYAREGMVTPAHLHRKKKEDIICRVGLLSITFWPDLTLQPGIRIDVKRNGHPECVMSGEPLVLRAGERVTIHSGVAHAFWPASPEVIIGEVSTANDDAIDNFFADPAIGRFPKVMEDEAALYRLVSDEVDG